MDFTARPSLRMLAHNGNSSARRSQPPGGRGNRQAAIDKGKPVARRGRKAQDPCGRPVLPNRGAPRGGRGRHGGLNIVRTLTSRFAGAALEAALISLIILALIAVPALAAKGGGRGGDGGKPSGGDASATISMVPMDSTDGLVHYGAASYVRLSHHGNRLALRAGALQPERNTLVYQDTQGYFPTTMGDQWFVLGYTPAWQSGAAGMHRKPDETHPQGVAAVSFPRPSTLNPKVPNASSEAPALRRGSRYVSPILNRRTNANR